MFDWYINEWLETAGMSQADLMRVTDYPKAKVSDLCTGKQRYNRDILNDVAKALHIRPYELLLLPSDAMAIRKVREEAAKIAAVRIEGDEAVNH